MTLICKNIVSSQRNQQNLSMICLSPVQHVFGWYLCLIQYKKNCFLFKKSMIPLSSLSKLYHKTDCYRFDEYKHKKLLQNHLGTATKLKEPRKRSLGRFSKNTLTHSEKRSAVAVIIHKNLTLIIIFTSKESLNTQNLQRNT